jgi:hypothetical protein
MLLIALMGPQVPPVPIFPTMPAPTNVPVVIPTPEHAPDWDDQVEDAEEQVDAWMSPLETINTALSEWLGIGATLPDASEGDFDTGLAPIQETGSAFEFAEDLGARMGTLFQYARAINDLPPWFGAIGLLIIGCTAWLFLMRFINFAISIADMLWSLITQAASTFADWFIPW